MTTPHTMVERVARGIGNVSLPPGNLRLFLAKVYEFAERLDPDTALARADFILPFVARAAIAAIREPTEAMYEAAMVAYSADDDEKKYPDFFCKLHQAMIDAILSEKETG